MEPPGACKNDSGKVKARSSRVECLAAPTHRDSALKEQEVRKCVRAEVDTNETREKAAVWQETAALRRSTSETCSFSPTTCTSDCTGLFFSPTVPGMCDQSPMMLFCTCRGRGGGGGWMDGGRRRQRERDIIRSRASEEEEGEEEG